MSDQPFTADPDIVRRRRADVLLSIQSAKTRIDIALKAAEEAVDAGLELPGVIANLTAALNSVSWAASSVPGEAGRG